LDKFVSPTRRARRGQVVRPKLDRKHIEVYPLHYKAQRKSLEKLLAISASGHHVWSIAGTGLRFGSVDGAVRPNIAATASFVIIGGVADAITSGSP
jgi:hypothetical protein